MQRRTFADGCHRWGWAIGLVGTLVLNGALGFYLSGRFTQRVEDMEKNFGDRITRLEHQIDDLTRSLR